MNLNDLFAGGATLITAFAAIYAVIALLARPRTVMTPAAVPAPVTVFKPLCGAEPRLEQNLETLFLQDHPCYELLFGVRDPKDAAIAVVERLQMRFPTIDVKLIVDGRVHGSNFKVSNLINLESYARYESYVVADSDIAVESDYLRRVTAPLTDAAVGIVTCLYRARPSPGFWARLGALFIDAWFMPSVHVYSAFGGSNFGFGSTIAIRRETLESIGGFAALSSRVADDFWMGQLTREAGMRTVLSDVEVCTDVTEERLTDLWAHEVRWLRTIRSLNPWGFGFTFMTYTLPVLAVGFACAPTPVNLAWVIIGGCARLVLYWRVARQSPGRVLIWLAPLRDVFLLVEWAAAWFGKSVEWRNEMVPLSDGPAKPYP